MLEQLEEEEASVAVWNGVAREAPAAAVRVGVFEEKAGCPARRALWYREPAMAVEVEVAQVAQVAAGTAGWA